MRARSAADLRVRLKVERLAHKLKGLADVIADE
jgi:hypothetical protein